MAGAIPPFDLLSWFSTTGLRSRAGRQCRTLGNQMVPLLGALALGVFCCCLKGAVAAQCSETVARTCHFLAYCDDDVCTCPRGIVGDGTQCSKEAWTVRFVLELPEGASYRDRWDAGVDAFVGILTDDAPAGFESSIFRSQVDTDGKAVVTINSLFADRLQADSARDNLANAIYGPSPPELFGVQVDGNVPTEPKVYSWVHKTTSAPNRVLPTGMDVQTVWFKPGCGAAGCWVVEIIYTVGENGFNSIYIPHAVGNDQLESDFDYSVVQNSDWNTSPLDTFLPNNFPCSTFQYMPGTGENDNPPDEVTACCIPEFLDMYRPIQSFVEEASNSVSKVQCDSGTVPVFQRQGYRSSVATVPQPENAVSGRFKGLNSTLTFTGVADPFVRQWTGVAYLDEIELRRYAGILTGTVGVESAIDTFIGIANFKPTGLKFLDPFAMQVNIRLERTSFFTVSTYGENEYTFIEYVNLRLVTVYDEAETEDVRDGLTRTNASQAAHYLQVTFTLGQQYQPIETGLVPIDSVLVSKGSFLTSVETEGTRFHVCRDYLSPSSSFPRTLFDSRFAQPDGSQSCAPNAVMCSNPPSIPDQFVVFNVPLGVDWIPEPTSNGANSVFIDMVVSAIDTFAVGTPNLGDAPHQMKTTLTASVPVVTGGVNVFCDALTARSDLREVVEVDLIIGSAGFASEMERLRILGDIANPARDGAEPHEIESASIEAGLMTLVLKGNASYFERSRTGFFRLEVEDLITVHVMEQGSHTLDAVLALLAQPPEVSQELDTDGYRLNGAFEFSVDRVNRRATLSPTEELAAVCPFSPTAPSDGDMFPSTCVTRRDIEGRGFPTRAGAATAVELPSAAVAREAEERLGAAAFMQTVVGPSDYGAELGRNFSALVAARFELDGRFRRAFWVNPGYEWTPAQTGGRGRYSLSQTFVMLALVSVDEGGSGGRRRMLLQDMAVDPNGAGVGTAQVGTGSSPSTLLAQHLGVPEGLVASFMLQFRLTQVEACMDEEELKVEIQRIVGEYLTTITSPLASVQITNMFVDKEDVVCSGSPALRRSAAFRRLMALSEAYATFDLLLAFQPPAPPETVALFNFERFSQRVRIKGAQVLQKQPLVELTTEKIEQRLPTAAPAGPSGNGTGSLDQNQNGVGAHNQTAKQDMEIMGVTVTDEMKLIVFAAAALLAAVAFKVVRDRRQRSRGHEVQVVSVVAVDKLKLDLRSQLQHEASSIQRTATADMF